MKIAVLGTGSIGKRHMRNLLTLGYTDISCMDPSEKVNEDVSKLLPSVTQYDSLESILKRARPDVVFICSPPQYHLEQLDSSIDHGCHVFVEKPFSLNTQGAAEVLKKADNNNLKVMTGFNMRYVKPIRILKNWVTQGQLGRVLSIRVDLSSYMPDWHPWEDYRECFMAFKASGGGALYDYVHGIDIAQWVVGSKIKTLSSVSRTTSLEMETDDISILIGTTDNGIVFDLYFDLVDKLNRRRIEVVGTNGTAKWELSNQHALMLYDAEEKKSTVVEDRFDWDQCYLDEIQDFFVAIQEDKVVESDGWNGLDTQEVIGMAVASNESGRQVSR